MAVTINLPQTKRIVIQIERAFDATQVNVYKVYDNLENSIVATVDFGTSDSVRDIILWTGDEYLNLTTFSKMDAQNRLMKIINEM